MSFFRDIGADPLGMTVDSPDKSKAATTLAPWQTDLGKQLAAMFGGLAGGASGSMLGGFMGGESAGQITSDWTKNFATPVMQMWQREIAPMIKEGYNLPGSFYSASTSKGLGREASNFFSGNVMPTLFSSLESLRSRGPQWAGIYANLMGTGAGLATSSTMQNFWQPGPNWQQNFANVGQGLQGVGSFLF